MEDTHSSKESGRALQQLQSLEKHKNEFLSVASHQLRTPLSRIVGYVSMLLEGDFGEVVEDDHREALTVVFTSSQQMSSLVDTFLHVTDIETGNIRFTFTPVNIHEYIEKQVAQVQELAKEQGVEIVIHEPKKDLEVMVDENIREVVVNLIDNAIRYSGDAKIVEISIEPLDTTHIQIVVHDEGIGIPKDKQQHLFEKFSRGENSLRVHPNGSGLGLYIAKHIVEGHGGELSVQSEGENKGTTSMVRLPIVQNG